MTPIQRAQAEVLEGLVEPMGNPLGRPDPKTDPENLRWMIEHALANIETFPDDKTGRWIGFIQGVLSAQGKLDVNEERDRTRPIFHKAYEATGIAIPATAEKGMETASYYLVGTEVYMVDHDLEVRHVVVEAVSIWIGETLNSSTHDYLVKPIDDKGDLFWGRIRADFVTADRARADMMREERLAAMRKNWGFVR